VARDRSRLEARHLSPLLARDVDRRGPHRQAGESGGEAGRAAMNTYFSEGLKGLKAAVEGGKGK
jgi:hypothetical protein